MNMKVYLWETKTTSEDLTQGSTFWKRTTLDPQVSIYIPAVRAMGHEPHGCIYDALRKPGQLPSAVPVLDPDGVKIVLDRDGKRVRTKDGKKWRQTGDTDAGYTLSTRPETPEEYGRRCLEAIAADPDRYYARGVVVRLDADEREAAADNWNTAGQMREARRLNIYPRNPDSCMNWSRECDYLNVCAGMATIDDPVLFKFEEDVHVELAEEGGVLADDLSLLTQSAMRSYRSCPRKFFYRYVIRYRPLKKAETLSTGTSIHAALDVFRRTGDLDAAKRALQSEDLFVRAKEEAMLMGYAARWGTPTGIVAIEQTFRIPLINPETGAASRTFSLGGRVDAIVSAENTNDLVNPVGELTLPPRHPPPDHLEEQLEASVKMKMVKGETT
jgi:hypothetical protein